MSSSSYGTYSDEYCCEHDCSRNSHSTITLNQFNSIMPIEFVDTKLDLRPITPEFISVVESTVSKAKLINRIFRGQSKAVRRIHIDTILIAFVQLLDLPWSIFPEEKTEMCSPVFKGGQVDYLIRDSSLQLKTTRVMVIESKPILPDGEVNILNEYGGQLCSQMYSISNSGRQVVWGALTDGERWLFCKLIVIGLDKSDGMLHTKLHTVSFTDNVEDTILTLLSVADSIIEERKC